MTTVAAVLARNVVSHHVQANQTYYVDLSPLCDGSTTVSSVASAVTTDTGMTISSPVVVSSDTPDVLDDRGQRVTLLANKHVQITVSGGTVSTTPATITVKFVKSDGGADAVDCLIAVGGQAA